VLGARSILSPSALRALPFIRSGVAQGLSANRLQATLTGTAYAVRRTDLLAAIRQVTGEQLAGDRLKFVRKDRYPDPARLQTAATTTLRRYSFVAQVRGFDPQTGQSDRRWVTVSTSNLMTVGDMESLAAEIAADPEVYTPFETEDVLITSAVRSGERGTLL
jgi:hypothetical protein